MTRPWSFLLITQENKTHTQDLHCYNSMVSVYHGISRYSPFHSFSLYSRDTDRPFLSSEIQIHRDGFTVLYLDRQTSQMQHADDPQRLTNGHIFIDEKVGREEVVQETWWLVGACDGEKKMIVIHTIDWNYCYVCYVVKSIYCLITLIQVEYLKL